MATSTYKPLGQLKPVATTLTDLYVVPVTTPATQTVISSLDVCNQSATATSFRVSVAVAGAVDNTKQYHYYDAPIEGNETKPVLQGITLAATDVVRVYATLATLSFNMSGVQLT